MGIGVVVGGRQQAIEVGAVGQNVIFVRRAIFVERLKITKNLRNLILFTGLTMRLFAAFNLVRSRSWEDHAIDEISDAFAISIVEYFADNAFEEGLILKLHLLLSSATSSLLRFEWSGIGIVGWTLGGSSGVNEAANVG